MANKDYDDLLRSFMNNSSKAYDEDRHAVEKQAQQAPVQRNAAADRAARQSHQTAGGEAPGCQKAQEGKQASQREYPCPAS